MDEAQSNETVLEEMVRTLMDAEGYCLFTCHMTNKLDEKGNRILEFNYRRYHLSFEDVKTAIEKFREAFEDEVLK